MHGWTWGRASEDICQSQSAESRSCRRPAVHQARSTLLKAASIRGQGQALGRRTNTNHVCVNLSNVVLPASQPAMTRYVRPLHEPVSRRLRLLPRARAEQAVIHVDSRHQGSSPRSGQPALTKLAARSGLPRGMIAEINDTERADEGGGRASTRPSQRGWSPAGREPACTYHKTQALCGGQRQSCAEERKLHAMPLFTLVRPNIKMMANVPNACPQTLLPREAGGERQSSRQRRHFL